MTSRSDPLPIIPMIQSFHAYVPVTIGLSVSFYTDECKLTSFANCREIDTTEM